ncbi:hypothetical protein FRB94_011801 [Tulasnella sp. JGI-2019a]|nr:hypothetical protein FRB94_011801 [Tulasnella sp. JGI-2019a]
MIDPIVHLSYASYRGRQTTPHTIAYLGIPYAESPAGPRRFRKPSPLDVDKISSQIPNAVFDATHYPPSAMQGAVGEYSSLWQKRLRPYFHMDLTPTGKDCLKLDIYTPAQATPKDQWPVMVYIHGGGYVFGSPKNQPFDHWIDAHPNVVIVAVYYRLSILGFLSHPEFQTSKVADNNAGLYDQLEALRWSAGGASVQLLLTAFSGRKQELFHRAIVQSAYRTPIFSLNQKKAVFDEFMQYLHCPVQILDDQVEWLRSMNAAELIQAADMFAAKHDSVLWEWKPLVDGELITDHFSRLVQIGRFVDVPVLTGTTTHDGRLIAGGTSFRDAFMAEFPGVDERDVQEIAEFYTTRSLNSTDAVGDALNCSAGVFLAEHFTDTWLYRFNEPAGTGRLVEHSSDNYLLFNGVQ